MAENYYLEMALHYVTLAVLIAACIGLYSRQLNWQFWGLLFAILATESFFASMWLPLQFPSIPQSQWVSELGALSVLGYGALALVLLSLVRMSKGPGRTP